MEFLKAVENQKILKDESGQGTAKYILLIGALIVIMIVVLLIFWLYFVPEVPPERIVEQIYDPEDIPQPQNQSSE